MYKAFWTDPACWFVVFWSLKASDVQAFPLLNFPSVDKSEKYSHNHSYDYIKVAYSGFHY